MPLTTAHPPLACDAVTWADRYFATLYCMSWSNLSFRLVPSTAGRRFVTEPGMARHLLSTCRVRDPSLPLSSVSNFDSRPDCPAVVRLPSSQRVVPTTEAARDPSESVLMG